MQADLKVDTKEVDDILRKATMKIVDLSKELQAGSVLIQKDIADHFAKEQSPIGKWTKRKDNKPHKILDKSGALKRSVTSKASANIGKLSIVITSDLIYAKVHNNGMRIRNKSGKYTKMPKRQFMWVRKQVKQKVMGIIVKAVV